MNNIMCWSHNYFQNTFVLLCMLVVTDLNYFPVPDHAKVLKAVCQNDIFYWIVGAIFVFCD